MISRRCVRACGSVDRNDRCRLGDLIEQGAFGAWPTDDFTTLHVAGFIPDGPVAVGFAHTRPYSNATKTVYSINNNYERTYNRPLVNSPISRPRTNIHPDATQNPPSANITLAGLSQELSRRTTAQHPPNGGTRSTTMFHGLQVQPARTNRIKRLNDTD